MLEPIEPDATHKIMADAVKSLGDAATRIAEAHNGPDTASEKLMEIVRYISIVA